MQADLLGFGDRAPGQRCAFATLGTIGTGRKGTWPGHNLVHVETIPCRERVFETVAKVPSYSVSSLAPSCSVAWEGSGLAEPLIPASGVLPPVERQHGSSGPLGC